MLEYATQGVTVTGEVKNPGIYPLLGQHTLMDLISAAGGVTSKAGTVVTLTHKADVQHPQILHIDNRPGSVFTQVDIRPGDTVSVAHAGVIYVVGDVGRAGGFLIETGQLTALQSLWRREPIRPPRQIALALSAPLILIAKRWYFL